MRKDLITLVLVERDFKLDQQELFNDKQREVFANNLNAFGLKSFMDNLEENENMETVCPRGVLLTEIRYHYLNNEFHISQLNALKESYSLFKTSKISPSVLYGKILYNNIISKPLLDLCKNVETFDGEDRLVSSICIIELDTKVVSEIVETIPNVKVDKLVGNQIDEDDNDLLAGKSFLTMFIPKDNIEELLNALSNIKEKSDKEDK